jgi:hypothetical protein
MIAVPFVRHCGFGVLPHHRQMPRLSMHDNRHPPDNGPVEAKNAAFDRFWQCQFLGTGLSCAQAGDIDAPSAENVDFIVIQTPPFPLAFDRTQNTE